MGRILSDFFPNPIRTGKPVLLRPKRWNNEQRAALIHQSTKKARWVIVTTESGTLPRLWPVVGLDKTQQPYNEQWSCPIPPKENRLKVRIEAGEKKYHEDY